MEVVKARKFLKIISMIGAFYEILFGFLMIFLIISLFNLIGANLTELEFPIFSQTAGLLAIIIGLNLLFSSLNVEKFVLNIILIILLRFTIQIIIVINIIIVPEIALGLFLFGLVDLIFALITIYLMRKGNLSFNILKVLR